MRDAHFSWHNGDRLKPPIKRLDTIALWCSRRLRRAVNSLRAKRHQSLGQLHAWSFKFFQPLLISALYIFISPWLISTTLYKTNIYSLNWSLPIGRIPLCSATQVVCGSELPNISTSWLFATYLCLVHLQETLIDFGPRFDAADIPQLIRMLRKRSSFNLILIKRSDNN